MRIYSVNTFQNNYSPLFGVNLQSKKLRFKNDDFFVKIKGYGTNSNWAKEIIKAADEAIELIRDNVEYESVLRFIAFRVRDANQLTLDIEKKEHTGILRADREWWLCHSDWNSKTGLITRYGNNYENKYKKYADRLDYTVKHPLKNPYKDISLSRPIHNKDSGKFIDHPDSKYINSAFEHIKTIYNNLYKKYILNEVKEENLPEVNNLIAEIKWILAHSTPWERGSDAISNTFIRAVYKAMGVKSYPLKRGISLDLEAYCTNLEEYKQKFASYFTHNPKIID